MTQIILRGVGGPAVEYKNTDGEVLGVLELTVWPLYTSTSSLDWSDSQCK